MDVKKWGPEPGGGHPAFWEPEVDYEDVDICDGDDQSKHQEPLQTIGDILFSKQVYTPDMYTEFNQDEKESNGHLPWQVARSSGGQDEEDADGNPKTFKRVLVRFAERTSMQGVPYIYVSSVWYAKVGWSLLFLVGMGLMIGHLYLLIDEYYQYDTHSTVTLGFSTLTFPAVTICNVNPIKRSKMYLASPELRNLVDSVTPTNIAGSMEQERNKLAEMDHGHTAPVEPPQPPDQASSGTSTGRRRRDVTGSGQETKLKRKRRFIEGFSIEETNEKQPVAGEEVIGFTGNKSTIRAIEDEFRYLFSSLGRDSRQEMGHSIDDMLMECTFRGISCSADQFKLVQTSQYGNCYTLENERFISTIGGPDDGLTLYLFTQDSEYIHGITNSMGFQVHIHNFGAFPNPYSEGLSVSAGAETFIGLKQVNIERLKHPYGECVENESFKNLYDITYSQKTCQQFCLQRRIVESCGCYDAESDEIYKSIAKADGYTDSNDPNRAHPCKSSDQSVCLRAVNRQFQEEQIECDCPSPCQETLYTKSLSSKVWPTTEYANVLVEYLCSIVNETECEEYRIKSRSDIAVSFLKMVVYFEDLNYENITEEVDYETFQFVSDVGGTIGLWIGLSMISFFEVIQFLYEMAHYFFYMKPKLARERLRKQKLRMQKRTVAHALRFINPPGMPPMTTVTSKLMGSVSNGQSEDLGSNPGKSISGPQSKASPGNTGSGDNSISSGDAERHLLSGLLPAGQKAKEKSAPPWYSQSSGVNNPAFDGSNPVFDLRSQDYIASPPAYMTAGNNIFDQRDLRVEFNSHKC